MTKIGVVLACLQDSDSHSRTFLISSIMAELIKYINSFPNSQRAWVRVSFGTRFLVCFCYKELAGTQIETLGILLEYDGDEGDAPPQGTRGALKVHPS